jgi:hypothetical protein
LVLSAKIINISAKTTNLSAQPVYLLAKPHFAIESNGNTSETNRNTGENSILPAKRTEILAKILFYQRNERKYRRKAIFANKTQSTKYYNVQK